MNFNEISRKNVTYDIKVTKKQSSALSSNSIFFETGLRHGFFLNETSMLVFVELAIFHII